MHLDGLSLSTWMAFGYFAKPCTYLFRHMRQASKQFSNPAQLTAYGGAHLNYALESLFRYQTFQLQLQLQLLAVLRRAFFTAKMF